MIRSFADRRTAALFAGRVVRNLPTDILPRVKAKLQMIDAASRLDDLRSPPGNRLERLKGGRSGQYSIRVSDRWRLCFAWRNGEAWDVEFTDYHRG